MKCLNYLFFGLFLISCQAEMEDLAPETKIFAGQIAHYSEEEGLPLSFREIENGIPLEGVKIERITISTGPDSGGCCWSPTIRTFSGSATTNEFGEYEFINNLNGQYEYRIDFSTTEYEIKDRISSDFYLFDKISLAFHFKSNDPQKEINTDSIYYQFNHPIEEYIYDSFIDHERKHVFVGQNLNVNMIENVNFELEFKYGFNSEYISYPFYSGTEEHKAFDVFID